jgi:ferric-dicitrate binding protein FerR (iron transport regulator)
MQKAELVDRDHAGRERDWQPAELGSRFFTGDGIRTGKQARAELSLDDGSKVELAADTVVRFMERAPGERTQAVNVETGEATFEATSGDVRLETAFGAATLESGGRLRLSKTAMGLRYEVLVGLARVDTKEGPAELQPGTGIEIGIGDAVIERLSLTEQKPALTVPEPPPEDSANPPPVVTGNLAADVSGKGVKVRAPDAIQWSALAEGSHQVEAGTAISVARGSSVRVRRGEERATVREGQYTFGGADGALISAQSGAVQLEAGGAVRVAVPGGFIVAAPASKADLTVRGKGGTEVVVSAGSVRLESESGTDVLEAGQRGVMGEKGGVEVFGRGPAYADMAISVGGSVVVHDPRPPTSVRFLFGGKCEGGGVVELVGRNVSSRGDGHANVLMPAGQHHYRLRCLTADGLSKKAEGEGRLAILQDPGTAAVPKTAPSTYVETDGRRYTVMYQNLLPTVMVRWGKAPQPGSYALRVTSPGGGTKTIQTGSASHTFVSGALAEGSHTLVFRAGDTSSRPTSVDIVFDNAAPKASITSPADRGFAAGAGVQVGGIAMTGWKVRAERQELALDGQARFSGAVTAPADLRALVIELSHPNKGVHYYLRRSVSN